jgi:hypothetical protein
MATRPRPAAGPFSWRLFARRPALPLVNRRRGAAGAARVLFQSGNRSPRRFASVGLPGSPMHSSIRTNSVAVRATTPFNRLRREAVVVFFTRWPPELVPASPYDRALYS